MIRKKSDRSELTFPSISSIPEINQRTKDIPKKIKKTLYFLAHKSAIDGTNIDAILRQSSFLLMRSFCSSVSSSRVAGTLLISKRVSISLFATLTIQIIQRGIEISPNNPSIRLTNALIAFNISGTSQEALIMTRKTILTIIQTKNTITGESAIIQEPALLFLGVLSGKFLSKSDCFQGFSVIVDIGKRVKSAIKRQLQSVATFPLS
jgi:hypothetical protein